MPEDELPEQRIVACQAMNTINLEPEELLRFSTLNRLLRVTAWCIRWKRLLSTTIASLNDSECQSLQPEELDDALFLWIRLVQRLHFSTEIASVIGSRAILSRSPLAKLCPFRDKRNILRVGGRHKNAILSYDERYPMILPSTS